MMQIVLSIPTSDNPLEVRIIVKCINYSLHGLLRIYHWTAYDVVKEEHMLSGVVYHNSQQGASELFAKVASAYARQVAT